VRRYARRWAKQRGHATAAAYVPLSFAPGEAYQFDWSHEEVCGLPLDMGCGWLHSADENEWSSIARKLGFAIDPTPPPWSRPAHELGFPAADQREFGAAWNRFYMRLDAAAHDPIDHSAAEYLEPSCKWNALLDALSSWINGAELDRISVRDFGDIMIQAKTGACQVVMAR